MKKYNVILFDLDGTLTDPGIGITNSVMHALERFGIEVPERSQLFKFIGPPLIDSFMNYYGMDVEKARQGVVYYREHYATKGVLENNLYEGIPNLLSELKQAGKKLYVATSKPEPFARQIIEHFGLSQYFEYVAGSTMDETRTKKAEVIEYVLNVANITDKSHVIMVGDREYDVIGAKNVGLDCLGVLYGYGDEKELTNAGATYIAKNVADVKKILL